MRKRSKIRSLFTGKGTNSDSPGPAKQSPEVTTSSKWYRAIIDLPLQRFIDCACDDNLHALVISGNPDPADLSAAWENIKIQYSDAVKDAQTKIRINLQAEVNRLCITIDQANTLISELRDRYVEKFARAVNSILHASFKFDVRFPQDYDRDLKRAAGKVKGLEMRLDMQLAALEKVEAGQPSKVVTKLTREYFIGVLIALDNHHRYTVNRDMTTFEFCARIKQLNQYVEQSKHGR